MIPLYFDEDSMDRAVVSGLLLRDFDVLTASEAGTKEFADHQQLYFAHEVGRVIYTFNAGHFQALHSEWLAEERTHSGIIIGVQGRSPGDQIRSLLRLGSAIKAAPQWAGRLEFLSDW